MSKEVLRMLQEMNKDTNSENDLAQASNAGYISGIMWVRGELEKIKEALEK